MAHALIPVGRFDVARVHGGFLGCSRALGRSNDMVNCIGTSTFATWMPAMLSRETLEEYRRMTPGQRLNLTLQMITENTPYLFAGSPEKVDRRFELLRRQNEERTRRLCEAFARAEKYDEAR